MRNPGQVLDQRNRITRKTSYGPIASPVESVVAMLVLSPGPPYSAAAAACSCPRFAAAGWNQGGRVSIARARAAVTASGGREDDVVGQLYDMVMFL